jgi:hypothetical protein
VAELFAARLKHAEPSSLTDLRAAAIDAVNKVSPLVSGFATQLGAMRKAIIKVAGPTALDDMKIMDAQEQVEKDLEQLLHTMQLPLMSAGLAHSA